MPPTVDCNDLPLTMDLRSDELPSLVDLESAAALVYRSMPPTPQYRWPLLDARVGASYG
jgi:hypothetical protein